jgi:hypothetical protein
MNMLKPMKWFLSSSGAAMVALLNWAGVKRAAPMAVVESRKASHARGE